MGINAAGKSTLVEQFVKDDYQRINRDMTGGSIKGQTEIVEDALVNGVEKVVLDNTYPTRESRSSIIKLAKQLRAKITCHWLTTSLEEAQLNVCLRMIRKYGILPGPDDFKKLKDPNAFPPAALFHYRKIFQPPTTEEGFDEIIEVPFKRIWPAQYKHKAIILDYDGVLRESLGEYDYPTKLSEIKVNPKMTNIVKEAEDNGFIILGASNQSGIAKGIISEDMAVQCFEETNRQLGIKVDFLYCQHSIPPVSCYCRKPHVGMGAIFIEKYKLCPSDCIMVGDQTTDRTFAERCGFKFAHISEFCK
jgi:HAD superfamily hydrolase (TIGR01662 family)